MISRICSSIWLFVFVFSYFSGIAQVGSTCQSPYLIDSLPFSLTDRTTEGFGDDYDNQDVCNSSYLTGDDFVFSYTPITDQMINISVTDVGPGAAVFLFKGCPDQPTSICMGQDNYIYPTIFGAVLEADNEYFIVISTYEPISGINSFTPFSISIKATKNVEIGIFELLGPRSNCLWEDNQAIVSIINHGLDTIYSFNIAYILNSGDTVTEQVDTIIITNSVYEHHFNTILNVNTPGIPYNLCVFTILNGDEDLSNDTSYSTFFYTEEVTVFPYFEDFENDDGGWVTQSFEMVYNYSSWEYGVPLNQVINDSIPDNHAWVTNLDGNTFPKENSLFISPCLDFTGVSLPILEFKIWYETAAVDLISVAYTNNGWFNKIVLGTEGGNTNWYNLNQQGVSGWNGSSGGWVTVKHDLDELAGLSRVNIGIWFNGDIELSEGVAIDDIRIYESPTNDLQIQKVFLPFSKCSLSGDEKIFMLIKNNGLNTQSSFDVGISIDNGEFIMEHVLDSIISGDTLLYLFDTIFDFAGVGIHKVLAKSFLTGDQDTTNDELPDSLYVLNSVSTFPFFEDFESSSGSWIPAGDSSTWEYGMPTDSVIATSFSGTNVWATNLSGAHAIGERSFLYTPCFDLSQMSQPKIRMKVWYYFSQGSYVQLYGSSDDGLSWQIVDTDSDSSWYNNGHSWNDTCIEWQDVYTSLNTFLGEPKIQFRFAMNGAFPSSGFALDDFSICSTPEAGFNFSVIDSVVEFFNASFYSTSSLWFFGDSSNSEEKSPVHTYSDLDTMQVSLVSLNACYSDTVVLQVVINNINEMIFSDQIKVFPIPAKEKLEIRFLKYSAHAQIELFDLQGQKVFDKSLGNKMPGDSEKISLVSFSSGVYFIRCNSDNANYSGKIVVE